MNILVVGAGAVGSAFGGFLRLAGHSVTLLGRRRHLDAIRENGLHITGIWGEHHCTGFTLAEEVSQCNAVFDAVLFCVKSHDTEAGAKALVPLLGKDTLVVSLQNGMGNIETISGMTGHPLVLGGRVIFGIVVDAPGCIRITVYTEPVMIGFPASGAAKLSVTAVQQAQQLALVIDGARIPCRYTDEIEKYLWAKMLYNCALNPLGALHRVHYGALMENPQWRAIMDGVVREIFAVAEAKRIPLFWKSAEEFLALFYGKLVPDTFHHRSSMLQDIEKGRRTEIENMNGMVVRYASEAGVPVPFNSELVSQIRSLRPLS